MRDYLIITATFLFHFSLCYCRVYNEDDYERNDFVDQFRKHLAQQQQQDRRDQLFHSKEGSYHAFPPYDVRVRDEDEDFGYDLGPYQRRVPWERQHPYDTAPKDTDEEEEEIDEVEELVEKTTDPQEVEQTDDRIEIPVEEKFKVEARADVRSRQSIDSDSPSSSASKSRMEVDSSPSNDMYFIALVAGSCAAAVFGVMAAGFCWYKFQKNAKAAAEAEYPAYGVTGPNKEHISPSSGGDRKLAQSAQMYHYQHQKQQMIAMEKNNGERQASTSDLDSEEENEEGDYTVYECPGLAPTGEMEVKNPLFQDEPTPASPPITGKPSLISCESVDSTK